MSAKSIVIDPEKLRQEIAKRGLTASDASREVGYNDGAITNAINRGCVSNQLAFVLDKILNIKIDDLKPTAPATNPEAIAEQMRITPEGVQANILAEKIAEKLAPVLEKIVADAMKNNKSVTIVNGFGTKGEAIHEVHADGRNRL